MADLAGQPLTERIAIVITSAAHLTAARGIDPHTAAWGIENFEHRPRGTVWREDDQQAHPFHAPRAMATFR